MLMLLDATIGVIPTKILQGHFFLT